MADKTSQISVLISKEINDRLNAYCKKNGIKKNFVVDRAISSYLSTIDEYDCESNDEDLDSNPEIVKL